METQRPAFGALLRQCRVDAGMTQELLAERARISVQAVSALERGARSAPRADTLSLLCEALRLRGEALQQFESSAKASSKPRVRTTQSLYGVPKADPSPVLMPIGTVRTNLPARITSFVGRETEVAEITALMRASRLVTLAGSGGIGKTRTSLEVATNLVDDSDDGVWFVELAPLQEASLLADTIAAAVGVTLPPDQDPAVALVDILARKHMVIVVDNCEHLVEEAARVIAAIVKGAPRVRVLATSRQGLGIAGEQAYQLPSLGSPPSIERDCVMTASSAIQFGAVALFAERARAADGRFVLTDANASTVTEIVRRLDGIALAIELAAPRVRVMDVKQLSQRLDERFRLLTGGNRDALPRQRTLRALIDWSYELLDDRERAVFARIGIFVDGFTFAAARIACDDEIPSEFDLLDVLSSLLDKSLLLADRSDDATRYRLLESTRAYALEKLDAAEIRFEIASRHLAWVDEFTQAAFAVFDSTLDATLVERFAAELGNIRSALTWARQIAATDALARIVVCLGTTRSTDISSTEMLAHLAYALEHLPATSPQLLASVWSVRAAYLANRDRDVESLVSYTAAVECADRSGAEDLIGITYARRSQILAKLGKMAEAESDLRLAATHESKLSERENDVLRSAMALFATFSGDYAEALRHYEQSFERHAALGVPIRYAVTFGNIAVLHIRQKNWAAAIAASRRSLALAKGDHRIKSIGNLVMALNESELFAEARAVGREGIQLSEGLAPGGLHVTSAIAEAVYAIAAIDPARAARLRGYTEHRIPLLGGTFDDFEMARTIRLIAQLEKRLGREECERLSEEGRLLSPKTAYEEAIRE